MLAYEDDAEWAIVQIVAAADWSIRWRSGDGSLPVVVWALCRNGSVQPMINDGCWLRLLKDPEVEGYDLHEG